MVQEGRDRTQTPSRKGGSAGAQQRKLRAHQTMQTESTAETHGSWSEMASHGLWASSLYMVPMEVLNLLGPELVKSC